MNEPTDELNELLAPLREIEPTTAMRAANRRAALEPEKAVPWWRRSISVPVPVAWATAAALLIAVGARFSPSDEAGDEASDKPPAILSPATTHSPPTMIAQTTIPSTGEVYDAASYVSGVGFIERVSLHRKTEE